MVIPISLVNEEALDLKAENGLGPLHIYITTPFSLLVRDFHPNTTLVPKTEQPRSWWQKLGLFRRRRDGTPDDACVKACLLGFGPFHYDVWPKLSTLLFGKEEHRLYTTVGSDAKEWEGLGDSNLSWSFSTGVTDDDIDRVRAIVLEASEGPTGSIQFTLEEIDEKQRADWKSYYESAPRYRLPGESVIDAEMGLKISALYRYMASSPWYFPPADPEKEKRFGFWGHACFS
jgi:hypothetical protein